MASYGVSWWVPGVQVKAQSTCDLLRARWCEPVLSVVDIRVGDDEEAATDPFYRFGPTRFSVIPRSAVGNVSVRFVPDQVQVPPQLPYQTSLPRCSLDSLHKKQSDRRSTRSGLRVPALLARC